MGFEIINAETRTARLVEWFAGVCTTITDFLPGSVARSKMETIAVEMEAQDYSFYQALRKAIPVAIYQAFDFKLRSAQKASGLVTFTGDTTTSSITIPAGTLVSTSTTSGVKSYATTADATIPMGETTVQAPVLCTVPGIFGNTPSGTVTILQTPIPNITAVTNAAAIANGLDRETEDSRRLRFTQYITNLTRGTREAIAYGASTAAIYDAAGTVIENVQFVNVVEPTETDPMQPAGLIYCYIYNGSGSTSDALVTEAQQIIDGYTDADGVRVPGYKAAGIVCTVAKAAEQPVNVTCTVTPISQEADKTAIHTACLAAIADLIQNAGMGNDIIHSQIISRVMEVDGVYRTVISAPSADVAVAPNTIPTVGTITVTVE